MPSPQAHHEAYDFDRLSREVSISFRDREHGHNNEDDFPLSTSRKIVLTCGLGGLQVLWATIFSNGTPFMLSLGLPKSMTALLWSAAPLAGLFVQVYVGRISDEYQHPWGRRRPFIMLGSFTISVSLLALAWSEMLAARIVKMLAWTFSTDYTLPRLAPGIAVFSFLLLCVAIQPLQCGLRALIFDTCSSRQQSAVNVWAARFIGIGNIFGCAAGVLDLPGYGTNMNTRFRMLTIFTLFSINITAGITCLSCSEVKSDVEVRSMPKASHPAAVVTELLTTYTNLSNRARHILLIQFISWLAWFGFLFYSASYVSDLCAHAHVFVVDTESRDIVPDIQQSRFGTFVNLLIAATTLITCILLPYIAKLFNKNATVAYSKGWHDALAVTTDPFELPALVWALSLALAAFLSFATLLTSDALVASVIMMLMGIPWAVANWAPFTLLGIATLDTGTDTQQDNRARGASFGNKNSNNGTLMGLNTMAVSAPQIIAAGICSIIIPLSQLWKSTDSLGWVLRAGGIAYLAATMLALRLKAS
ncbi:hypothetical protein F4777DRAFT_594151 [Nemania sp. FL0916]|nr:hypothetical protein F4777DRAFT_594151 [Nemania sp. FL0916]